MKKILIINTSYSRGGAAKVARQVFHFLRKLQNFDVYFAYGRGGGEREENVIKFGNILETYFHAFLVRFLGIEGWGTYFSTRKLINFINKEEFDLVHIHNLHGYYLNFFKLIEFLGKSNIPIIWTLHDEWAFTWMPAYSLGCGHCKTLKGRCVNINDYPKTYNKLFSKILLRKKQKLFRESWKPVIVCPAKWIELEAKNSLLSNFNIRTIYNGIDIEIFKPAQDRIILRKKYKLPENKRIILLAVSNYKEKRKGLRYIIEVMKRVEKYSNYFFVGLGTHKKMEYSNFQSLGYISSEKQLSEIYSLSDVLLYTSLAETMPLTVIEAMSCGLPVVAFDIPPLQELVDKETGILVKLRDVVGLTEALKNVLANEEKRMMMGRFSRDKVVNNFNLVKTLSEYLNLYNLLLSK